jgi:hypothetical protein
MFQLALAIALLLSGCARARESTSSPDAAGPPPTFLEAEPDNVDAPTLDYLTLAITDGLVIGMHVTPLSLGGGSWGFELELEFQNQLVSGQFDLGPEPVVTFSISVTLPDGSGFGSGGGCTFGSNLHGYKEQAIGPGERRASRQTWTSGVDAGQVLEVGIGLCRIQLPDGRSLGGAIAKIDAVVDADGKLATFELRAVEAPRPRP